jgi:hypothetical protein
MVNEEPEKLTEDETIKLSKAGNSDAFIVPAYWLKTIRELKREPLLFYAHIERDSSGRLFIIFQKARASPPEIQHNGP